MTAIMTLIKNQKLNVFVPNAEKNTPFDFFGPELQHPESTASNAKMHLMNRYETLFPGASGI
jgi:hypothetical protein